MKQSSQRMKPSGFSLIELIIGIGVMATLSVAFMMFFQNMQSSQMTTESKFEEVELRRSVVGILTDSAACKATFNGISLNGTAGSPITNILNAGGVIQFTSTTGSNKYGSGAILIQSMKIVDLGTVISGNKRRTVLEVQTKRLKPADALLPKPMRIPITAIATGPTAPITDCYVEDSVIIDLAAQKACASLDGTWNAGTEKCEGIVTIAGTPIMTGPMTGQLTNNVGFSAPAFTYTSDARMKANITAIDDPMAVVKALEGVQFDWKSNGQHDFGFIAQDVQKQIPEIVKEQNRQGALSVDYAKVIPFLVEAIKRQQKEIDQLKAVIGSGKPQASPVQ